MIIRDVKHWFQRRIRGWSDDETWGLDVCFMKWINSRFKKYKKLAGKIIDLEFYKYEYNGKTYTQLQLIDLIITDSELFLYKSKGDCTMGEVKELKDEVLEVFKLIYFHMGW